MRGSGAREWEVGGRQWCEEMRGDNQPVKTSCDWRMMENEGRGAREQEAEAPGRWMEGGGVMRGDMTIWVDENQ